MGLNQEALYDCIESYAKIIQQKVENTTKQQQPNFR